MERLAYTTQKTSDDNLNKGRFADKLDVYAIIGYAKDAAIGLIMGIGSFLVLLSTFGLSWSHTDWPYGGFIDGMINTWNIVAKHLAAQDGVFLPQLEVYDVENGFFLAMVLLFLIAVGVVISFSRNKGFIIFYALLVGLPSIIWGIHPSVLAVAVLAAGILLFIVNSDIRNIFQNYRGLIYAAIIAAAAFVLLCVPAVGKLADRPTAVDKFRENTQEKAVDSYYGTNPLHDGDLTVKSRGSEKGTALEVTMSNPESMYLRGFVGDVLTHDGWKPLSSATYYEDKNLFYWLGENGFNGLGQISQSAALAEQGGEKSLNSNYREQSNYVEVENINANKKYAYVPYEISQEGAMVDEEHPAKNWGDSFLTGGKLGKVKSYSFSASQNRVATWTDTASKFYTNKVTVPEQKDYLENESYYNEYIYKKFTYISDDDRYVLETVLGDKGDQKRGHVEYNTAITHVKQLISTNFFYTDELDGYEKGNSSLENIFVARTGYDAQLATAAVMMFRYYGIPARYVEGYLVTEEDVATGSPTIDVSRANAHAWAEIYVDGIGFVPVEVCDEFAGKMREADYTIGISSKNKNELTDKSKENNTDPNVIEEKTKTNAGGKKIPHKGLIVLGILAGLLLLALLVFLIRLLVLKILELIQRRKLFKSGEPREAVRAIYRHMDDKKITPDDEARDIGNRASYSVLAVTEADRLTMLKKLKDLKEHKSLDVSKIKDVKGKIPKPGKSDKAKAGDEKGTGEKKEKVIGKWGALKKKSKEKFQEKSKEKK